jgi:hypothetical protein
MSIMIDDIIDLSNIEDIIKEIKKPKSLKELAKKHPMPFRVIRVIEVDANTDGSQILHTRAHQSKVGFEMDIVSEYFNNEVYFLEGRYQFCTERDAYAVLIEGD